LFIRFGIAICNHIFSSDLFSELVFSFERLSSIQYRKLVIKVFDLFSVHDVSSKLATIANTSSSVVFLSTSASAHVLLRSDKFIHNV